MELVYYKHLATETFTHDSSDIFTMQEGASSGTHQRLSRPAKERRLTFPSNSPKTIPSSLQSPPNLPTTPP